MACPIKRRVKGDGNRMANEDTLTGFVLTCESCAAKLKVSKPSLVGQMLACPKCGTMLKIVPPADGVPDSRPASASDSHAPHKTSSSPALAPPLTAGVKTELTTSDFEEIELLLKKNPSLADSHSFDGPKFRALDAPLNKATDKKAPAADSKNQASSSPGMKKASSARPLAGSSPSSPYESAPLLPNDQWLSAEAKKRKQMTTLLACGIGVIVILAAIVVALLNGFGSKDNRQLVQSNSAPPGTTDTSEAAIDNPREDATSRESAVEKDDDANPVLNALPRAPENAENGSSQPVEAVSDGSDNRPPAIDLSSNDGPPPLLDTMDQPPPVLPGNELAGSERPNTETPDSGPPALPAIPDQGNAGQAAIRQSDLDDSLSRLDRLSQLVENAQLSSGRVGDLAAHARQEQRVGIRRYVIDRMSQPRVEATKQLAIPCESFIYDHTQLQLVLSDLMLITGVPMTLDLNSIIAHHQTANPNVHVELRNTDFGKAIEGVASSSGLAFETTDHQGLIFFAANRNELVEAIYELPDFIIGDGETKEQVLDEFRSVVLGMVDPDSWKLDLNPSRFTVEGSKLTLINTPPAQYSAQRLIEKIKAATSISRQPEDSPEWPQLETITKRFEKKMEQPSGLEHRFSEPLVEVLTSLSQNTRVAFFVDWEALAPQGWDPLTKIPGTIAGGNLRSILNELTMALEITYVIIDDDTILLTSFERAAQRADIEAYSFVQILRGKITEQQALALFRNSLAVELSHPQTRMYYDKNLHCLIVSAPQLVQLKVEALVKALETY
jgi:hypothetical protein